jgi:hypothetical protein
MAPSTRPHPAIVEAREVIALEQEAEDIRLRRVFRAMELAPTLHIARELLNGEQVPTSRLDREAVRRYGLRIIGTTPDRVTLDDFNHIADRT